MHIHAIFPSLNQNTLCRCCLKCCCLPCCFVSVVSQEQHQLLQSCFKRQIRSIVVPQDQQASGSSMKPQQANAAGTQDLQHITKMTSVSRDYTDCKVTYHTIPRSQCRISKGNTQGPRAATMVYIWSVPSQQSSLLNVSSSA